MIESPRCAICQNKEYRNVVNFGYVVGDMVHHSRVKMCKDCELNYVKKVAEDVCKEPIYIKKTTGDFTKSSAEESHNKNLTK